jgi:hypothetical protein
MAYLLPGNEKLPVFLAESAKVAPLFAELFASAKAYGPLASFDSSESWVECPYREGVALIGDAAAVSDPAFGEGMPLMRRDVRVLRDQLSKILIGMVRPGAMRQQHDNCFSNAPISGADTCRSRSATASDPSYRTGSVASAGSPLQWPDPMDETVKIRFFGEC